MFGSDATCFACLYYGAVFGLTIFYFILLRVKRGNSIGFCNTVVAVLAFVQFATSASSHTYLLYGERVTKNETSLASADLSAKFKHAVMAGHRWFGNNLDERIFLDEYQILLKTFFGIGFGVIGSLLSFMTLVGHLQGCSCIYITQTVTAVWNMGILFCWLAPEFLGGQKHLHNAQLYLAVSALPLTLYSLFAVGGAYCGTTGSVKCTAGQVCKPSVVAAPTPAPVAAKPVAAAVASSSKAKASKPDREKSKKH